MPIPDGSQSQKLPQMAGNCRRRFIFDFSEDPRRISSASWSRLDSLARALAVGDSPVNFRQHDHSGRKPRSGCIADVCIPVVRRGTDVDTESGSLSRLLSVSWILPSGDGETLSRASCEQWPRCRPKGNWLSPSTWKTLWHRERCICGRSVARTCNYRSTTGGRPTYVW